MELPANPADLLYGVYGKQGGDLTKEKEDEAKKLAFWALSDDEDEYKPMSETPFDVVDYNMWS